MTNDILNRIDFIRKNATKSEQILIDFLYNCNMNDIIYLSITELSDMVNVSEATILRFCQKLNFSGYQEFKLQVALGNSKNGNENGKGYHDKIADNMISAISSAKDVIDCSQIDKAVDFIINSHNRFFFGVGNSYTVAVEAKNRLMRAGIFCHCCNDSHLQSMISANLTPEDVIIFISVSGSTLDVIEAAKFAKSRGVRIIVITSYEKAPLCKYADVILYSMRKEGPLEGGSLITKVTQLYTTDVLCTAIYMKLGDGAKKKIEQASKAVLKKLI